jgi:hypothetical protein
MLSEGGSDVVLSDSYHNRNQRAVPAWLFWRASRRSVEELS